MDQAARTRVAVTASLVALLAGACDGDPPLPTPGAPARLHQLVAGPAELVGDGASCSDAPAGVAGPSARWCAFYRHPPGSDGTELWVVDVSQAGAGLIACDGSSPSCLRLTQSLWTGLPLTSTAHPSIHRFDGDTLMYYADATSKDPVDDPYRGPVRAWRPGWPAGRALTGAAGSYCSGQAQSASAMCVDNLALVNKGYEVDLLAGVLADADGGPLPKVAHPRLTAADGSTVWRVTFSPDGAHLAYSSPGSDGRGEVLRVLPTAEAGRTTPVESVRGAARWQIANDGQKVYFLRNLNTQGTSGTLTMADFPGGTNATELAQRVGGVTLLGQPGGPDQGVGILQDMTGGRGTFRILRDRGRPDATVTVERDVSNPVLSPDLRYTSFSKRDAQGNRSGYIAANDGRGACVLNFKTGYDAFAVVFANGQRRVLWAEDATIDGLEFEGFYADPEDCGNKRRFARSLAMVRPVGQSIIYAETEGLQPTMVLKHAALDNQGLPADGGEELGRGVDFTVATVDQRYVVFTVNRGAEEDLGIWVYGPLP